MTSFASVVRMVKVSTNSPGRRSASEPGSSTLSGTCQRSHSPANAMGSPSRGAMSQGWRAGPEKGVQHQPTLRRCNAAGRKINRERPECGLPYSCVIC